MTAKSATPKAHIQTTIVTNEALNTGVHSCVDSAAVSVAALPPELQSCSVVSVDAHEKAEPSKAVGQTPERPHASHTAAGTATNVFRVGVVAHVYSAWLHSAVQPGCAGAVGGLGGAGGGGGKRTAAGGVDALGGDGGGGCPAPPAAPSSSSARASRLPDGRIAATSDER